MDLLHVMNQEDEAVQINRADNTGMINNNNTSSHEYIREQDLNLRRLNHHYSQHVERQ